MPVRCLSFCAHSAGNNMSEGVDLYNNVYAHFSSRAEADVRHHAFGEDIGQSSWMTAARLASIF